MPDWLSSMQQTFEYYVVDPITWKDTKKLDTIISCSITRDLETETLGSASFKVSDFIGECYIRVYLITIQNGITEKHPLGTFLVQTPSTSFNGKVQSISMDAYTPLLELKENMPALGYSIFKEENIMEYAYRLTRENTRAPVSKTENTTNLQYDFVADPNDTWLTFLRDLIANANYIYDLDEMGRILFSPKQDTASLQPVWTYNDDNSSILYPDISVDQDLYGIPNVVEVIYSKDNGALYSKSVNSFNNSPTSTVNRGRKITYRATDPEISGNPTQTEINEYAEKLLRNLSCLEYKISYTHGYCPVRLGDCVRLNYTRAGLNNIKAKVISQTIKCEAGCQVTENVIFTKKLLG